MLKINASGQTVYLPLSRLVAATHLPYDPTLGYGPAGALVLQADGDVFGDPVTGEPTNCFTVGDDPAEVTRLLAVLDALAQPPASNWVQLNETWAINLNHVAEVYIGPEEQRPDPDLTRTRIRFANQKPGANCLGYDGPAGRRLMAHALRLARR